MDKVSSVMVYMIQKKNRGGVYRHVSSVLQTMNDQQEVTLVSLEIEDFTFFSFLRQNVKFLVQHFFSRGNIYHFHDYGPLLTHGFLFTFLHRLLGAKVFVTFHGWEGVYPPQKKVIWIRKVIASMVDGSISIGHYIDKWYQTKSTQVVYGGALIPAQETEKMDDAQENSLNDSKTITYLGRLDPDTGFDLYLQAWKILERNTDLIFNVCGDGSFMDLLLQQTQDTNRVKIQGHIEKDIRNNLLSSRIIFTSGYLSMLEAFELKRPVVAVYDNPLKRDYLTMIPNYQDMFWIASTVEEIVEAVHQILTDDGKIEKARQFAQDQTWKNVSETYLKLWNKG